MEKIKIKNLYIRKKIAIRMFLKKIKKIKRFMDVFEKILLNE